MKVESPLSVEEMAGALFNAQTDYHGLDRRKIKPEESAYWIALARAALSALPAPDAPKPAPLPLTTPCPSCGHQASYHSMFGHMCGWGGTSPTCSCRVKVTTIQNPKVKTMDEWHLPFDAPKPASEAQGEAPTIEECDADFRRATEAEAERGSLPYAVHLAGIAAVRSLCLASRAPSPSDAIVRNLAMLVRRIKAYPKTREKLIDEAIDYCNRVGVGGSVLRDVEAPSPSPALSAKCSCPPDEDGAHRWGCAFSEQGAPRG